MFARAMAVLCFGLCSALVGGCAGVPVDQVAGLTSKDPAENINRRSFALSEGIDRRVLKPVATGYQRVVPEPVRQGVANFFSNIRGIDSALNGFLQGKPRRGFTDVSRVLVNSTLGLGGLFDPATRAGIEFQDEDFGQTLAVWGYTESAYVYLPVVGPTTVRDLPSIVFDFFWPRYVLGGNYNAAAVSVDVVSRREQAIELTSARDATALHPYVFTREAYYQRRRFQIYDGAVPETDRFDEFEEFDELDELDEEQ